MLTPWDHVKCPWFVWFSGLWNFLQFYISTCLEPVFPMLSLPICCGPWCNLEHFKDVSCRDVSVTAVKPVFPPGHFCVLAVAWEQSRAVDVQWRGTRALCNFVTTFHQIPASGVSGSDYWSNGKGFIAVCLTCTCWIALFRNCRKMRKWNRTGWIEQRHIGLGWDESEQSEFKPRGLSQGRSHVSLGRGPGARGLGASGCCLSLTMGQSFLSSVPHFPHLHGGQVTTPLLLTGFDQFWRTFTEQKVECGRLHYSALLPSWLWQCFFFHLRINDMTGGSSWCCNSLRQCPTDAPLRLGSEILSLCCVCPWPVPLPPKWKFPH